MKTLKKTLCLVLAVVMVVGVLILPASATDYVDDAEITHKEAVTVLTELGILTGDEGFRPGDTLTRAEAAAVISRLAQTPTVANRNPKGQTGFADVDVDKVANWASGYIAYCASKNIVGGNGVGFAPNDNVTGTEFAKMLLCTVGYDAEIESYGGKLWSMNVIDRAIKVKLDAGIDELDFDADLTRDNMAQMTYNALMNVNTVTYENGKAKEGTETLNDEVDYGVAVETAATLDAAGRPASRVVKVNGTAVYTVYPEALKTYNTAKKFGDILKDVKGANAVAADMPARYFVDGVLYFFRGDPYDQGPTYSAQPTEIEKNACALGDTTYVYTVKEGGKDVYYIVRLTDQYIVVSADNYKDGVLTLDDNGTPTDATDDLTTKIEAKTDDMVVYKTGMKDGKKVVIETAKDAPYVAATIMGAVTAKNATEGYIRLDNSTTKTFKGVNGYDVTDLAVDATKTYTFYLDANENIIGEKVTTGTTTQPETAKTYAYLLQIQIKAATGNPDATPDLFGEVDASTDAAAKAKLVFLDDTPSGIVDVAVVKATEEQAKVADIEKGHWYLAKDNGDPDPAKEITEQSKPEFTTPCFVSYVKRDEGYILTPATEMETGANLKVQAGKALVTYGTDSKAYGTSTSVLTVITHDDDNYTVASYTGYTKFVDINKVDNGKTLADAEKAVIEVDSTTNNIKQLIVMVKKDAATPTPVNSVRALYVSAGEEVVGGTTYKFIVDGKEVEYVGAGKSFNNKTVYTLTFKTDNTIDTVTPVNAANTNTTFTRLSDDKAYIVVGDGSVYYLAAGCVIVDATGTAPAVATAIPEGTKTVALYVTTSTDTAVAGQISLIVALTK